MNETLVRLPGQPSDTKITVETYLDPCGSRRGGPVLANRLTISRPDKKDVAYILSGRGEVNFEKWEEFPYLPHPTLDESEEASMEEARNLIIDAMHRAMEEWDRQFDR